MSELDDGRLTSELKNRLLNCLLINRHFTQVLEKKQPDFTDYVQAKKSIDEKIEICEKFVRGGR